MPNQGSVQLDVQEKHVVVDNGIVKVTISKPAGFVTGISYQGVDNLLESRNEDYNRGYWDLVWSDEGTPRTTGKSERIKGTSFEVVVENEEMVEISFSRKWDSSLKDSIAPINVDKRFFIMTTLTHV